MPNTNPVSEARALLGDAAEARRHLFDVWVNTAEATFQASAELHNAALASGLSLLDTATTAQRGLASQWQATAQQVQQAGLEAVRAQLRAAARLVPTA